MLLRLLTFGTVALLFTFPGQLAWANGSSLIAQADDSEPADEASDDTPSGTASDIAPEEPVETPAEQAPLDEIDQLILEGREELRQPR